MQNIKTLKDFLKFKSGKELNIKYPIKLFDEEGKEIYLEDSNGYWCKQEFDEAGKQTYFEDSNGFWYKQEFDEAGKRIYQENLYGYINYKRPVKEMSVAEIEKALGHRVRVIK